MIITPDEYLGSISNKNWMAKIKEEFKKDLSYSGNRAVLVYELPLNEVPYMLLLIFMID